MASEGKNMGMVRYNGLRDRSFKQLLRCKLFEAYGDDVIGAVDFSNFTANEDAESGLSSLFADMGDVRYFNSCMRKYVSHGDNKQVIKEYKENYAQWFDENVLSCKEFLSFWDQGGRKCGYCGISEIQIKSLINNGKIETKRLYSRGRTMEIDRIEPNGEYSKENVVLSCYWCNNAKTDEFTFKEFMPVAAGIKAVWNSRLASIGYQTI